MDAYQDLGLSRPPERPSRNIRSASDASTIVVGGSYDQSMKASEFPIDGKVSPSRPESVQSESKDYIQTQIVAREEKSALQKDTSQQTPKQDGYSAWENNLDLETKDAKARTESWAKIAEGVLTFASLFSVVLVTFLLLSLPLLQPDPTDTTNLLLTQIAQQSSSSGTGSSQPLSHADDSSFRPHDFAVRVNAVWLISLSFSTTCALLAILLQQYALNFMQSADKADTNYSLLQRTQIYTFYFVGVERFAVPAGVELLSLFLHISLFLFLTGLVDFLLNVNHTLGHIMMTLVALAFLMYFIISIMPLCIPNSPYYTPLSLIWWFVRELIILLVLYLCKWSRLPIDTVPNAIYRHQIKIWKGMRPSYQSMAIQPISLKPSDEASDSEEFLGWLYELYHGSAWFKSQYSERLKDGLERLVTPAADKLFTFTSNPHLKNSNLRSRRLETCLKAIWCFHGTADRHFQAIRKHLDNERDPWGPLSAETWKMALDKKADSDSFIALRAHFIQALIAVMWEKNKRQFPSHAEPSQPTVSGTEFLRRQLGTSGDVIDRWSASGDQLQLAVAANLLTGSLPLLRELEAGAHAKTAKLRIELKEILDAICHDLDQSDVPHELRARFVDSTEVRRVFPPAFFDLNGSWTKVINTPSTDIGAV